MRLRLSVLAVGILWGLFCAVAGDAPVATTLAQMVMPWVWVAALVGACAGPSPKPAAVSGAIALLAANVTYFLVRSLARLVATGQVESSDIRFVAFWSALGLVVGPLAGVLGRLARSKQPSDLGMVVLCSASVAEPLAWWWHVDQFAARVAYLIIAALGVAVALRRFASRPQQVLLACAAVYPIAIILEVALNVTDQISPPLRLI